MSADYPEIEVEAVRQRLQEFRIVDVRQPQEFEGPLGHVAGSELVPLGEVADASARLREGKPLLVVCRSGNRSGKACAQLVERGVAAPTNLAGGMIAWNRAGLPVERSCAGDVAALLAGLEGWLAVFAGDGEEGARSRIDEALGVLGTSREAAAPADLPGLLATVERSLRAGDAPADLDVVVQAFRSDAEALANGS